MGDLLRIQSQPQDVPSATGHISRNLQILRSITIQTEVDQPRFRTFKTTSPVKFLSSFLNGGTIREPMGTQQTFPKLGETAPLLPPTGKTSGKSINKREIDSERPKTATVFSSRASNVHGQSLEHLEETMVGFIVALSERRGDIIESTLRGRHGADDHQVDEVYKRICKLMFGIQGETG